MSTDYRKNKLQEQTALGQALGSGGPAQGWQQQQPQQPVPQSAGWESDPQTQPVVKQPPHPPPLSQPIVIGQNTTVSRPLGQNGQLPPQGDQSRAGAPQGTGTTDVTTTGQGPVAGTGVSATGLNMNGLHGFDQTNFNDPQMQSVKYRFARLAQKAGARTPSQMGALVLSPEFQKEFPGARFNGKDIVNFNGALSDGPRGGSPVGDIDVLMGADQNADTAQGTWWGWDTGGGGAAAGGGGGAALGGQPSRPSALERMLAQNGGNLQTQSLDEILRTLQQQQPGMVI